MGGFANHHIDTLLDTEHNDAFDLVATIDPDPSRCRQLETLAERGIPAYSSIDEYLQTPESDLVIVATPIHLHCAHTIKALRHGSHVYCEKPVAATIQDAHAMAKASDECGRRVAVGYQWTYSDAVQQLKADVVAGDLGRPRRFRTRVFWPRKAAYYNRNSWAGQLRAESGEWVLDSPVNNAASHYLHNCLYLLGDTLGTSAVIEDVQAELYRANPISNYDTAALRVHTRDGVEILYYSSHAVPSLVGPVMTYEFDNATVTFDRDEDPNFVARFHDGTTRNYGSPDVGGMGVLGGVAAAIRDDLPFLCGVEAAMPLTLAVNLAQESAREIVEFPASMIESTPDSLINVPQVEPAFTECCARGILPAEHSGLDWAVAGSVVSAHGYASFDGAGV